MRHKLFYLIITLASMMFASCGPTTYVLKGNYAANNSIETETSYDAVWNNVIDFFAMNNLSIAVLEKDSGIIVASNATIGESLVTMEDENGKVMNGSAWFVMPYLNKSNGFKCVGNKAVCTFNVRVRKIEENKTFVSINLGGIQGIRVFEGVNALTFQKSRFDAESTSPCISTGKFERDLLNLFK